MGKPTNKGEDQKKPQTPPKTGHENVDTEQEPGAGGQSKAKYDEALKKATKDVQG